MKLLRKLFLVVLLGTASSCAMIFNEKTVDVSINSNPPGATIFIEGKSYGKTPATLKLEPKKYSVLIAKEGYGSAQLQLDYWVTIRNGKCMADVLGTMLVIPYYSYYWSGKCNDFKQKDYFVTIPRTGGIGTSGMSGSSMMNFGQNPSDMVNYYYNQDVMNGGGFPVEMNQENSFGQGNAGYNQSYQNQNERKGSDPWQKYR
jgi:hypothetical protein